MRFASYYDRNEDLYEEMARDRQTELLGMIGKSAVSVHIEIYNVWLMVNHTVLASFDIIQSNKQFLRSFRNCHR